LSEVRSSKVGRLERMGDTGGGDLVVMGAWFGGERWYEFLRIPFGLLLELEGLGGE